MFKHQTYRLAFSEGGFNGNDNYDLIEETSFVSPSRNISLHNGLREKRPGTSKDNAVAITASPKCLGIGQWIPSNSGTMQTISAHSDGKIWKDQATAIKAGMSQTNRFDILQAGTIMTICDGVTIPQVYDGTNIADVTEPAADWSASHYPKFMVVHSRGASQRLVAFGAPGFESSWYMSGSGVANYQKFVTGVLKFTGDFGDLNGAVAAIDFNQDLFIFGKKRALILNDSDTNTANWGWVRAPWEGGAAHQKLVIKVDNDVYVMTDDGDIYTVRTAAQTNDYKRASMTRPAFIHRYIQNNVDLSKIAEFHVSYEPKIRALLWWVVRTGQTLPDTALAFYLDRPVEQAWSIWDGTDNAASGIRATASATLRNTDGSSSIHTGDNSGFIWKIDPSIFTDDSMGYTQVLRTPWLAFKNPRNTKRYIRAELVYVVSGAYPVNVRWFVDDAEQGNILTSVGGVGNVFPLTFGTSTFGASALNQTAVDLGQIGRRIMFEISNSEASQNLRCASLLVDFEDRGPGYL